MRISFTILPGKQSPSNRWASHKSAEKKNLLVFWFPCVAGQWGLDWLLVDLLEFMSLTYSSNRQYQTSDRYNQKKWYNYEYDKIC